MLLRLNPYAIKPFVMRIIREVNLPPSKLDDCINSCHETVESETVDQGNESTKTFSQSHSPTVYKIEKLNISHIPPHLIFWKKYYRYRNKQGQPQRKRKQSNYRQKHSYHRRQRYQPINRNKERAGGKLHKKIQKYASF